MLPGNVDPRRPEKQQRYKPPPASNNAAPGEDLTPDYMNILDPQRKSMQTPRSDRFKVVKIESTEPFKRGRWKCMDFLDQSYAKVFQQNFNNNRSSECRPPSPKNDPNKINSSCSWSNTASHIDLQSSMLQIFYRQNSLENQCSCCNNGSGQLSSITDCCKHQNHVLMPGMVSSSLIGLDFPIELHFIPDNPAHLPLIFNNNLECCCKNQASNVDIQKFHQNMSSEHVTIQPTQISNYAQIQTKLNVAPQELLNQNSGINVAHYVQNLIPNESNKSVRNFPNIKEEQIIETEQILTQQNLAQQNLTQQNYLPSSQAGTEYNNNNNKPIYVNVQNLTCPPQQQQQQQQQKDTSTNSTDQQVTSTSSESPHEKYIENVCDSTTEQMAAQNNQINGNFVPLVQETPLPPEYFQNLVQNLDPNNPNLVQKFVVPTGTNAGNNVHYIVYSPQNNCAVAKPPQSNCTATIKPPPSNYVQNIVQNTVNASQNLITNENLIQGTQPSPKGNSNSNLPQINSSNHMVQNAEKITQNVNLYQGQISVVEASTCAYKIPSSPQQPQEVTPIFQNSQNSIQNSLPSNTCIHAFLTEERALVQNTTNDNNSGGKLVSNLPVDTKIEALMDLVKKHLKCTVMEDVNVLKHKILELKERIAQLEYENELLKNQYKRNSMQ